MKVILIVLVLLLALACAPYPETTPGPEISSDGDGYKLFCDYYPAYNLSLLYIRGVSRSGMTGQFFAGNICK